jgi:hypothetical protein
MYKCIHLKEGHSRALVLYVFNWFVVEYKFYVVEYSSMYSIGL